MEEIYHSTTPEIPEDEAFSLQKEWKRFLQTIGYLLGHWRILFMIAIIGILVGAAYYWLKPVSYISRTTFVVEESKMGGGS
ncbi:MAG: hypothetical protein ABIS69_10285, partial [Sediminibacterium sp.]